MNKSIAFLIVVLLLSVAAVKVPMTHEVVITTTKTLFSIDVGTGATYRVTFDGTLAKYLDNNQLVWHLLDGRECTPDTIRAAYIAAGFTNVRVQTLM